MILLSILLGILSLILNSVLILWNILQTLFLNEPTIALGIFSFFTSLIGLIVGIMAFIKMKNIEKKKTQSLIGIVLCAFSFIFIIYWICIVTNI